MKYFDNKDGKAVLDKMVAAIQENTAYLSEIDGLIGDGDHGSNMNKGFTIFANRTENEEYSFGSGLDRLGTILFQEIGGSMGPIYGSLFMGMGAEANKYSKIETKEFYDILSAGIDDLFDIIDAREGDKTLVDALLPAKKSLEESVKSEEELQLALEKMKKAAEDGKDATKDMIAKYGRSSRLGERSRGVLDAGATSCSLLLSAAADGIIEQLRE